MDIKQLRYIVQIADSGSISKAGELLRVAQPSLSLQLKSVEEELGVQLLSRNARGVAMTENGKVFVEYARHILHLMNQIPEVLRSATSNPTGKVRVGLPTSASRGLSMPLIKAATHSYPNVKVHIVEAMTGYLDEWIQSGKLDIALLYNHRAFGNIAWTEMLIEELMVVAAVGSDVASMPKVEFAALAEMPLAVPAVPNILRNVLQLLANRLDVNIGNALDCDSLTAILKLVEGGYISVLPSFAVQQEVAAGILKTIPLVNPTPSWSLSVVVSKRTANVFCSEAIAKLMAETMRAMVENGQWRASLKEAPVRWVG